MEKKYNIIMKANCTPSFLDICYENSMDSELSEEFGENFIQNTRKKVKEKFNKLNNENKK